MNAYDDGTLRRVSKAEAHKLWRAGKYVYACPCNLVPGGWWGFGGWFNAEEARTWHDTFNSFVCSFESYNCVDNETGKRASFYVNSGGGDGPE